MSTKKAFWNVEERNMQIALRVIAVMYFLTIIALQEITLSKTL